MRGGMKTDAKSKKKKKKEKEILLEGVREG